MWIPKLILDVPMVRLITSNVGTNVSITWRKSSKLHSLDKSLELISWSVKHQYFHQYIVVQKHYNIILVPQYLYSIFLIYSTQIPCQRWMVRVMFKKRRHSNALNNPIILMCTVIIMTMDYLIQKSSHLQCKKRNNNHILWRQYTPSTWKANIVLAM